VRYQEGRNGGTLGEEGPWAWVSPEEFGGKLKATSFPAKVRRTEGKSEGEMKERSLSYTRKGGLAREKGK